MFAAFAVMRHAHEMLWYLREAATRSYDPDNATTAQRLTTTLTTLTRGSLADLLGADLDTSLPAGVSIPPHW